MGAFRERRFSYKCFSPETLIKRMNPSSSRYWDFSAPIAGVLFTLAFAPFDYAYLALLALVFLFASWQAVSAKRAALRGYLFGVGAFGSGVSWVYISMHDFGGAGVLAASTLTALFVAFWALFPALAAYVSVRLQGAAGIVIMPGIWLLIEYVRGYWVLNGFPWLHGGYSQLETPLAGYIPIVGVYGTGFILALTASILLAGIKADKKRGLMIALALLWGVGAGLRPIDWTHPVGAPTRVAMIQGNIAQDQKWRPENKINTLLMYRKMTQAQWAADIVIWPETAIPAYLDQVEDNFLRPLAAEARQHDTDLIISIPVQEQTPIKKFNAVITLGGAGGMYRKMHLLPFGEYLPLQPLSGFVLDLVNIKLGNFTPGAPDQPLLKAAGYPFITLICYEDVFGDLGIRGLPEAAFLVNVTNDGWFGDSIEPHQHMQMARMRALETGRFLLRSTNTGVTAIVSPQGGIVKQAPLFQQTALTGSFIPMGGMTPYAHWGDHPVIAAIVVLLLGAVGYRRLNLRTQRAP